MENNLVEEYKISDIPTFYLIGVTVRTMNQGRQAGQDISALWERFFSENIKEKIPGKLDDQIVNLYTDYESDHNGPYTVFLGCRVGTLEDIPEGMAGTTIPGGKFAVYNPSGKLPDIVINTWMNIWEEKAYTRRFQGDFDVYGPVMDVENAEVEVWVGVN